MVKLQVIKVLSAVYGRTDPSLCLPSAMADRVCTADVIGVMSLM